MRIIDWISDVCSSDLAGDRAAAIGYRLVLQIALAALIADRAVERMVDEQKLHHPFARLLYHRAVGLDDLPLGGRQRARRLRLRRAGRDLDEAHAAIAGDRQAFMVEIGRASCRERVWQEGEITG